MVGDAAPRKVGMGEVMMILRMYRCRREAGIYLSAPDVRPYRRMSAEHSKLSRRLPLRLADTLNIILNTLSSAQLLILDGRLFGLDVSRASPTARPAQHGLWTNVRNNGFNMATFPDLI